MVLAFKFWGAPVVMHVLSLPCLSNEPLAGVDHSHRVLSFEVHLAGRQSRTTKTRGCPDFSALAGIFFMPETYLLRSAWDPNSNC